MEQLRSLRDSNKVNFDLSAGGLLTQFLSTRSVSGLVSMRRFVSDGGRDPHGRAFSFDAFSTSSSGSILTLVAERKTPAILIVFDLLAGRTANRYFLRLCGNVGGPP